jgi:hypothetical protein
MLVQQMVGHAVQFSAAVTGSNEMKYQKYKQMMSDVAVMSRSGNLIQ